MSRKFRFISWNVNGIRACIEKGFWSFFDQEDADFVCLQETKITAVDFERLALNHSLIPLMQACHELPLDHVPETRRKTDIYYALACAKKPGYSGVGLLTKHKPLHLEFGLGDAAYDDEGRVLFAHYPDFTLVNTYFPNGQRDLKRIPYKLEFTDCLLKKLQKLRREQPNILICGDMNVAHTEIDIKNPKSNIRNSGFTQEERDSFSAFLKTGYVDTFRALHPEVRDAYSWWSYRPGVRQKNIGWRIDYFVASDTMAKKVETAEILMNVMGSDHCPVTVEIKV